MSQPLSSRSFSRSIRPAILALSLASLALGCGQSDDGAVSTTDESVDDALRAVKTCQAQARECAADGGGVACEEQLRACLMSAMPDGGKPAAHPQNEAGRPDDRPEPDAGREDESEHDGGPAHPSTGSGHPAMPDAAVNALTNPVGHEGGPAVLSCVDELRACLATDARPSDCAEVARGCLQALHDAGKP